MDDPAPDAVAESMDEAAREAVVDDVSVVCDLAREGRAGVSDARGGPMWLRREAIPEPLETAIAERLESLDSTIIVATIDGVVLGFMIVDAIEDDSGRIADITELYVTPDARGIGLGEHMMEAADRWADARGCSGMTSRALPGDRATKNYFETHGLVARSIEVLRRNEH